MRDDDERQQHSVILPELPFRVPIKPEEPVGQCPEILVILVNARTRKFFFVKPPIRPDRLLKSSSSFDEKGKHRIAENKHSTTRLPFGNKWNGREIDYTNARRLRTWRTSSDQGTIFPTQTRGTNCCSKEEIAEIYRKRKNTGGGRISSSRHVRGHIRPIETTRGGQLCALSPLVPRCTRRSCEIVWSCFHHGEISVTRWFTCMWSAIVTS